MATISSRALVVAPTPELAQQLASCLSSRGITVDVTDDFDEARHELNVRPPQLLVTELKLGAFNGLHLAMRARTQLPRVATIVIGEADSVLQAEALKQDVRYVVGPIEDGSFMNTVGTCAAAAALRSGSSDAGRTH